MHLTDCFMDLVAYVAYFLRTVTTKQPPYEQVKADVLRLLTQSEGYLNSLEAERGGGLRFGPLRKAELYEIYKEKFSQFKGWFESGSFMEELLREFEKTCQRLYNVDQRRER